MAKAWELEEFWKAKMYLRRKMKLDSSFLEIEDYQKEKEALEEFNKNTNATMLQEWINKYLSKEQIQKLRVYLRVEKSRRNKRQKNITITPEAHFKLSEYAISYNVTLSEAIIKLFEN